MLTPAEAFVLLDPKGSSPTEAFKIAFLWLAAQAVLKLTMVERRRLIGKRSVAVVSLVRQPTELLLAREIATIVRRAQPTSIGIGIDAIAKSAVTVFGDRLLKLKTEILLPSLVARALLNVHTERVLWVFKRLSYRFTAEGEAERRRILIMLGKARRLPFLLRSDPAEAKAVVLAAGAMLLLVPELKPYYRQLAALNPTSPVDLCGGEVTSSDSEPPPSSCGAHHYDSFNTDGLDLGACHFGAFDIGALDLHFGSFDAHFRRT
jgi:hypothetical protein